MEAGLHRETAVALCAEGDDKELQGKCVCVCVQSAVYARAPPRWQSQSACVRACVRARQPWWTSLMWRLSSPLSTELKPQPSTGHLHGLSPVW